MPEQPLFPLYPYPTFPAFRHFLFRIPVVFFLPSEQPVPFDTPHLLSVLHFDILLLFDAPLPFVLYFSLKLMPLPRQTVLSDFPQPDCKTLVHRDPSQEHTYPPYIYQALWEIHPSFFLLPDYIWD